MEIRKLELSDQVAFEEFQAKLLDEKAAGNSFIETKKVEDFAAFVEKSKRFETQTDNPDWSTSTNYYAFVDESIVGRIGCRWQIEKGDLLRIGGHIGYATAPDFRQQGVMTKLLAFALEQYRQRGIKRVLITAREDNLPSRKTIEKVGGKLENILPLEEGHHLARYWIDLEDKHVS